MNTLAKLLYLITWPAIFLAVRNSDRTRVIIQDVNKILVVSGWIGIKKWQLPGGGIKRYELPKKAAIREVFEETGLVLDEKDLKSLGAQKIQEKGFSYNAHFFICKTKSHQKPRPSHEIRYAKFVSVHELTEDNITNDVLIGIKLIAS